MTRPRLVLLAVATAAVAALLATGTIGGGDTSRTGAAPANSSLLDVELVSFDGTSVVLGEIADGKPAVVNFFASWCGPCVREMPHFEAVHSRRGTDVAFVGVNLQHGADAAAELVEQTGVTYAVVRDEEGELFRAVGGFSMPTTVFLDADGAVVELRGGELSERALEERIDRLLQR